MNDLISRQAAIDAIDRLDIPEDMCVFEILSHIELEIGTLPSVQPQKTAGRWIEVDDAYNRISGRCSACGWESHMYEDDVVGMNYCPNCGADMRGKQDGH